MQKEETQPVRIPPTQNKTAFVHPNRTYASVAANQQPNKRTIDKNLLTSFLEIAKEILEEEQMSVESRIKHFLTNFKQMTTETRKQECLDLLSILQNDK